MNTGRFVYTTLKVTDSGIDITGSPFEVDQDITAGDLYDLVADERFTIEMAQSYLDNRYIENSPTCTPSCLGTVITDEYPAEIVQDNIIGISFHAKIDSIDTCVSAIISV